MGIEAIATPQQFIDDRNSVYQKRRDKVLAVLKDIGLYVDPPKASLYVWARIPSGFTSAEFTTNLLEQCDIVVTPGSGYGPSGEGYIRLSLTTSEENLTKGLARLAEWKIPRAN